MIRPQVEGVGMRGRVKMEGDFPQPRVAFGIPNDYPAPNCSASWNVAPTDSQPIVRYNARQGHRAPNTLKAFVTRPYPAEWMTMWPVSTRVGNGKVNGATLVKLMVA
jgi:putative SOS response-associated peptidase YedK